MEGPLELNICLPSNREDIIIFDLGAREVEDRRTLTHLGLFQVQRGDYNEVIRKQLLRDATLGRVSLENIANY